jgi:hypothetical protein
MDIFDFVIWKARKTGAGEYLLARLESRETER